MRACLWGLSARLRMHFVGGAPQTQRELQRIRAVLLARSSGDLLGGDLGAFKVGAEEGACVHMCVGHASLGKCALRVRTRACTLRCLWAWGSESGRGRHGACAQCGCGGKVGCLGLEVQAWPEASSTAVCG